MMCHVCAAEGYPYSSQACKNCEFNPTERMVSINDVMQILSEYMVCDGLYREIDNSAILCKLIQVSVEITKKEPEEWFE